MARLQANRESKRHDDSAALTAGHALLVSVTPTDPATFVGITVLFLAVVVVSALVPAFRAARVDPVVAIHHQ